MEKEFVPFEFAVKLKMLGFSCDYSFKEYDTSGVLQHTGLLDSHSLPHFDAPLWQQTFEWFRDKHNAIVCFNWHTKGKLVGEEFVFEEEVTTRKDLINWAYEIDYYGSNFERELTDESDASGFGFETYEQARYACLEKLIELVSQKPS